MQIFKIAQTQKILIFHFVGEERKEQTGKVGSIKSQKWFSENRHYNSARATSFKILILNKCICAAHKHRKEFSTCFFVGGNFVHGTKDFKYKYSDLKYTLQF